MNIICFFETIITSFVPSLATIDHKGEPVYAEEERSEEQLKYVEEMHK